MQLPDFIIIGAMKCGTSTLAAQLGQQAGVFMTTPKEPNFFSDDAIYARGEDWYQNLFSAASETDVTGEASTHYTKLPTYPETLTRMQAAGGQPKLVYVIRNPVERAISHYIHEWTEARMGNDPIEAFAQNTELVDYGRYAMQIAPFIDAYGQEAVLLSSLEQIKADPHHAFAEVAAHLGLPDGAAWDDTLGAQNVSAERARKLPLQGLLLDNPVAQALRRTLIPKALRSRVRQSLTMQTRPELPDALVARLEAEFLKDRSSLGTYFPGHPALQLCYPFAS